MGWLTMQVMVEAKRSQLQMLDASSRMIHGLAEYTVKDTFGGTLDDDDGSGAMRCGEEMMQTI